MENDVFQAKLAEQRLKDREMKAALRLEAGLWLSKFKTELTTSNFNDLLDKFSEKYSRIALDTPQAGFYRDACLARRIAHACNAETIWLGANPPDFHIKYSGGCVSFEATEIIRPGRKRANDMRELEVLRKRSERREDVISKVNLLRLVSDAYRRKNVRQYTGIDGLVLYANAGRLDAENYTREIVEDFFESCRELDFSDCIFSHVWLVYSHYVGPIHGNIISV